MQELQFTKANGRIIISCVVIETPIGINPKILAAKINTNKILKTKEVFVSFS
jgi:hypothetical protein